MFDLRNPFSRGKSGYAPDNEYSRDLDFSLLD